MLEHVPAWMGKLLTNVRAGHEQLSVMKVGAPEAAPMIPLSSPAFAAGARLPIRFTADGEGVSPPLKWGDLPAGTASVALIVEDPDAPAPNPLVHALVWDLPPDHRQIEEGAIGADMQSAATIGRNSYFAQAWLPPDPPTGHGAHDYVFQLFALSQSVDLGETPGRSAMLEAIADRLLGVGLLVGTYSRAEASPVGPATLAPVPAPE